MLQQLHIASSATKTSMWGLLRRPASVNIQAKVNARRPKKCKRKEATVSPTQSFIINEDFTDCTIAHHRHSSSIPRQFKWGRATGWDQKASRVFLRLGYDWSITASRSKDRVEYTNRREISAYTGRDDAEAHCAGILNNDEIWEKINPGLDRLLGFGRSMDDIQSLIRRGPKGIDGFCEYLEYLIAEKGLKGGLIEGKISVLIDAIWKRWESCLSSVKKALNRHRQRNT